MKKLNSVEELFALRDKTKSQVKVRVQGENISNIVAVTVFMGNGGFKDGAKEIFNYFFDAFSAQGIEKAAVMQGDIAESEGPNPLVRVCVPGREPMLFSHVTPKKADEIIEKYIKNF